MANKKFARFAVLGALGLFALTGCSSEVFGKPSFYSDKVVTFTPDVDVHNNTMEGIIDKIHEGSLPADVLNKLLYQYSVSVLGRYNAVVDAPVLEGDAAITLKAAYCSSKSIEKDDLNAFVRSHKAYWTVNAKGERINDDNPEDIKVVEANADACLSEAARVEAKWLTIEERIAEAMYSTISSGSYSYRNKFSERSFLISLRKNLKNVAHHSSVTSHDEALLDVSIEPKDVFNYFLHREFYQSNYSLEATEVKSDTSFDYVEKEIIPNIYRDLLVEQYILDESYSVLGRSSARKVNIIAISSNTKDEYKQKANHLMKKFVKDYLLAKPSTSNARAVYNNTGDTIKVAFDRVSDVWKGTKAKFDSWGNESAIDKMSKDLISTFDAEVVLGETTFYKGTVYGDLMEEYNSIKNDPNLTDSGVESSFTGSGSYPISVGKQMKEDEISLKNYITTDWHIKDGGLSSLPTTIKNRLFNSSVSVALDREDNHDRYTGDTYNSNNDYNDYVAKINGHYFLKNIKKEGTVDPTTPYADDILFTDNGTYYVVEILEAVSASKLSKTGDHSYAKVYDNEKMEEVINSVVSLIGEGETYKNLSKKHWLKKMNLQYHDQKIYDYFKSNFPELFED